MSSAIKPTIGDTYDRRHNGLSTIRLALASTVVLWHSFPLTGHDIQPAGLREVVGSFRVDAFFAISGFLILQTWTRHPDVAYYIRSRALRIYPAFLCALTVTALVIVPAVTAISGKDVQTLFVGPRSAFAYIVKNASTWIFFFDINGTPTDVPFPGAWNGSIWMLKWEVICYIALLGLGILGLTKYPKVFLTLAVSAWSCVLALSVLPITSNILIGDAARFALMFSTGACVWAYAHKIPSDWRLAALSAIGIIAGIWMPDYRLTAAPALAYLVIWLATKMTHARWSRTRDC